jgi:hypothetical protein
LSEGNLKFVDFLVRELTGPLQSIQQKFKRAKVAQRARGMKKTRGVNHTVFDEFELDTQGSSSDGFSAMPTFSPAGRSTFGPCGPRPTRVSKSDCRQLVEATSHVRRHQLRSCFNGLPTFSAASFSPANQVKPMHRLAVAKRIGHGHTQAQLPFGDAALASSAFSAGAGCGFNVVRHG